MEEGDSVDAVLCFVGFGSPKNQQDQALELSFPAGAQPDVQLFSVRPRQLSILSLGFCGWVMLATTSGLAKETQLC